MDEQIPPGGMTTADHFRGLIDEMREVPPQADVDPIEHYERTLDEKPTDEVREIDLVLDRDSAVAWCPYYLRHAVGADPHGICNQGCYEEPVCQTSGPHPEVDRLIASGRHIDTWVVVFADEPEDDDWETIVDNGV